MPQLIKKINGEIFDNFNSTVKVASIEGFIQDSDHISINGLIVFLQDYSQVYSIEPLTKPMMFGLKQISQPVTLSISY